jgi:hypothetical protein
MQLAEKRGIKPGFHMMRKKCDRLFTTLAQIMEEAV